MNPLTDRVTHVPVGDGRVIEVRQPGAIDPRPASTNWRFTEDSFRRYEGHLRTAVTNWPNETSFQIPHGTSPNTFVRCLREARTALLSYPHYSPDLEPRLRLINDEVAISMDPSGSLVWFRKKGNPGRPRENKVTVAAVKRPLFEASAVQPLPSENELQALCILMKSNRITGPFHFSGRLDPSILTSIEGSFDVAFAYDSATDVTTMI